MTWGVAMATLGWQIDGQDAGPLLVMARHWARRGPCGAIRSRHWSRQSFACFGRPPGHGESASAAGAVALDDLGADLLELLDAVATGRTRALCRPYPSAGMVGMWLAIPEPERVVGWRLVCTSATLAAAGELDDPARDRVSDRIEAIADVVVGRWFTPAFAEASPDVVAEARDMLTGTVHPIGYGRMLRGRRRHGSTRRTVEDQARRRSSCPRSTIRPFHPITARRSLPPSRAVDSK